MRIFIISWSTLQHLELYPESISRLRYLHLRHLISRNQVASFYNSQVVSYLHKNCSCLVTLLSVKRTSESKAPTLRSNYLQYHPSTNHRPHIPRHCDHTTMIWPITTKRSLMHHNCQAWTLHLSFAHHVHCRLYIPQKSTIIAICLLNTGKNLWRHGCVTPIRNCTSMWFSAGDTGFGQRMVKLSLAAAISFYRGQRLIRITFTRHTRTRWMLIPSAPLFLFPIYHTLSVFRTQKKTGIGHSTNDLFYMTAASWVTDSMVYCSHQLATGAASVKNWCPRLILNVQDETLQGAHEVSCRSFTKQLSRYRGSCSGSYIWANILSWIHHCRGYWFQVIKGCLPMDLVTLLVWECCWTLPETCWYQ